jgi:3-oxoacyl-[acyl-carrier protein] reductase
MTQRPVALVTGASRGIGRAVTLGLAAEGWDVAGLARGEEGLTIMGGELAAAGTGFLPLAADISERDRHPELIEAVFDRFGRCDLLVNNAGVAPLERRDLLELTPKSWLRVLAIDLEGPFFLTQALAGRMLALPRPETGVRGRIIFITSISAETSSLRRAEYCVAKAGLSMAARLFADRLLPEGVLVHEVRPGIIDTEMTAPVRTDYQRLADRGEIPIGRLGTPEDVARVVVSIARGDLDYAAGSVIDVSGGLGIRRL